MKPKVVLTGGVTGGHLYPALAIAQELRSRGIADTHFICSDRAFDRRELTAAGFPFTALPSAGLGVRGAGKLFRSVRRAVEVLSFLRPDCVAGFGGHGSAAGLMAARLRGVPIFLFEQNSRPGKVTRLFAHAARRIYLQWPCSSRFFGGRARVAGSPLRPDLARLTRGEARRRLGIPPDRVVVTILGGSQGAVGLNSAILEGLDQLPERAHPIHIAGTRDFLRVREAYRTHKVTATVFDYCRGMGAVYSATDVMICRAGALTLQELASFRLPAVLVPLETAADGHQAENAGFLAQKGCAQWKRQAGIGAGFLKSLVLSYLRDRARFDALGARLGAYFPQTAANSFIEDFMEPGGNVAEG